uniref:Uncharacterized protein MANES_02G192600 n=1 Tax=Rhizophora mucronata TaxID=61149 RepID=A0A2P2QWK3_RHIMU
MPRLIWSVLLVVSHTHCTVVSLLQVSPRLPLLSLFQNAKFEFLYI